MAGTAAADAIATTTAAGILSVRGIQAVLAVVVVVVATGGRGHMQAACGA
jgi:hypothetical protein